MWEVDSSSPQLGLVEDSWRDASRLVKGFVDKLGLPKETLINAAT
jgi:hypothetical protein